MFYSQFILAKKGPLGTIWIAAHLERKLRKNQVADTDIGFSVDSILFPDVPIALRLSSHLLLGVVRIYSRKVNYLFDDCSEALLKIKQAFRSTAVDLPPEESTAPYHSITLPETFDLDDFELPDEMFQGNYVDHHISAKEQITLQDTMDGVVYSTSQFGLDERFGEGDASQIGLEIDEDLFLPKVATEGNDGVPDVDPMESAPLMTPGEKDENYEGIPGTSAMMQEKGNDDLTEIPAVSRESFDHFQTPFTPGLECPSPLNVQETVACNSPMEGGNRDLTESEAVESDANKKSDTQERISHSEENGFVLGDMATEQGKSQGHSDPDAVAAENISADSGLPTPSSVMVEQATPIPKLPECSNGHISAEDGLNRVEDVHNGVVVNNEQPGHLVDRTDGQCAESPSCSQVTTELEDPGRRTCSTEGEVQNNMGESCSTSNALTSNVCPSESPDRPEVVNDSTHEHAPSKEFPALRACNSVIQPDLSSPRGEVSQSIDALEMVLEKKVDEEMDKAASCDINVRSADLGLPAPEKLLSVPDGLKQNDLLVVSTPEKEVFGDNDGGLGTELISGKKRSFTESTLTVRSLNSGESFSMKKSRRTAESIPGDDDLLSSILVGRKSSVLKLKPTPPAPELISTKRQRSAPRASALKRKVLMDDMMVLHGDTIRQQLTNSEDIRRLRKKAPCTRREIAMIQRQFLEEEIFSEPIFTGLSAALSSLHRETFALNSIKVTEKEEHEENALIESEKDVDSSVLKDDKGTQPDDVCIDKENSIVENSDLRSQQETQAEVAQMEIDEQNIEVANVTELTVHDLESLLPIDSVANDFANAPENILQQDDTNNDTSPSLQMDVSSLSPLKFDMEPVDGTALAGITEDAVDTIEVTETDAEVRVDLENHNSNYGDGNLAVDEIGNSNYGEGNLAVDEIGNTNIGVVDPDVAQPSDFGCDEKDPSSICMLGEGAAINPGFSLELDGNAENALFDKGENADFQEQADLASAVNPDIEFRGEFDDVMVANDTEFLNVDDDEVAEDDEDYAPGAEDTRLPENSGWSSRTRAVSKYLQTLFEKESQHGKRVLAMDNLLTGKTRKEASRMFFETLVLKTKDYVHVEQAKPFDNINVKPRIKLMKSDF